MRTRGRLRRCGWREVASRWIATARAAKTTGQPPHSWRDPLCWVQYRHSEGRAAMAGESGGGGAVSWLIWIGILLLVNFLSWAFNWPFWVY